MLTRQHVGRKDETVGLITDLPPKALDAAHWLKANRMVWGIENGTHQRLDVSLNEDRCRVRSTNALWILGMLRRSVISLFAQWRAGRLKLAELVTGRYALEEINAAIAATKSGAARRNLILF